MADKDENKAILGMMLFGVLTAWYAWHYFN
jgi:hypothetical protein